MSVHDLCRPIGVPYVFGPEGEEEVLLLPLPYGASYEEIKTCGEALVKFLGFSRGEQPETTALPEPGALRGDIPLSIGEAADKEMK